MRREEAIAILDRRTTIPGDGYSFDDINEAIDMAIEALRPITHEQVEKMRGEWRSIPSLLEYYCSRCGEEFEIHAYDKDKYRFCPYCMAPMTDEAVDILWKLLEALHENVYND